VRSSNLKFILLGLLVCLPSLLYAQDVASLTGLVTDKTGALIARASVLLENTATNAIYRTTTNSVGSYTFANVPPGPGYKLTFSVTGFEPLVVSDIYLNVATTRTQDATLQVGGITETLEITAGGRNANLDTTGASIGNNYNVGLVNELPVQDRDTPSALFTLQPGVTLDGSTTGARVDQNNVTLDGLDVNDIATGAQFFIVANAPVDAVQEFRGTVAGFPANSGPGGGGQYQLVTKSGTNAFHGNLNEYHRDTATEANEWFSNNTGVPRAPLIRNQFGGNLGGPILKNKLFFFFDYYNSRIIQSTQVNRSVPLDTFRNGNIAYIKNTDPAGNPCAASSRQDTTPQCIGILDSNQVAALDPLGIGFNASLLSFIDKRYPHANNLTGGDGINSGYFTFNAPDPDFETNYVGRVDYNLGQSMKLFARFNIARENGTEGPIQFPGDPVTYPFTDRSYAYVIGYTWTINSRMVNQFIYGKTVSDYGFPTTYNPQGTSLLTFSDPLANAFDDPYATPVNSQSRVIPIPMIGDDFNWQRGNHSLQIGGTFKFIKSYEDQKNDYNLATIGIGGNTYGLNPSLRPSDINNSSSAALNAYDYAFTLALGRVANINSDYNFDNKGSPLPLATGDVRRYRYYQTQLYLGDTWKLNSSLTLSYGVNYQLFSVPYETQGLESVEQTTFDQYFSQRQAQSAAGLSGNTAVPFITYILGGKANHAPGYYKPSYKDVAPRFSFAFNPVFDRKSVFNGSAGIVYDRTVINAVQYQQDQSSYLFQQNVNYPSGIAGDATGSLLNDPRLGPNNSFPSVPTPAPITPPYQPFVSAGVPFGLINGLTYNTTIDPNLRTPYSVIVNSGFQHELAAQVIMKINYVGRFGRRLLAQADASQLIDFPDQLSGQMLSNAFGNLTEQIRAGVSTMAVAPQPWFEDLVPPGTGASNGYASNTAYLADNLTNFVLNGDFADFVQALASGGLVAPNVGMASQFAENTFFTNKGFSTYHGLLATLQKNMTHGLQFDLNYTWAHSIDNVSIIANQNASGGYGFICEVQRMRVCRGNSDFDIANNISSDFTYSLPFGKGRPYMASAPLWLNEVVGEWDLSGITRWHSGPDFSTVANAFVAGYANDAPGIFNGDRFAIRPDAHKRSDGSVNEFADAAQAASSFTGPVGFTIGSRNNLRGPNYVNQDLGLGKTFPIGDKVNLKFRTDAFNAFNHASFSAPSSSDITNGLFGQITTTSTSARVLQFSLRLEF
jgi:Carboxypeptidase regulatory-like domain